MSATPAASTPAPAVHARARRLVSVGHSYCITLNRRLTNEIAREGRGRWEVTTVAPSFYRADLRPVRTEADAAEVARLETVPVRFSGRPHVMLYGRQLREILRQRWDLVHSWEEPYILAGGQIARWVPEPTPFVFFTCQNIPKRYPVPFSRIEKYSLDRCSGWLAIGHSTVEAQLGRGYGARPHRMVGLGVDVERFRPSPEAGAEMRARLGWDDSIPVVGFLGRFIPEKGLELLMRALERTAAPWRALLIGGGPMEGELRRWAERFGDRVRVVTSATHDEVPAYLNAMQVMCAPSQTAPQWREQLGRMLIEAFACGVPVVASDSGEIPHVVGDAGIIVGERDLAGWEAALTRVLTDPAERARLREAGLERAHRLYAWPVVARNHLDFFAEILDGSPGVAR